MSLRRQGRLHQTVAAQQSEVYWDYQPDQRVITIDGPGRVIAVSDGPFPGAEEYEIRLEGGLGGGTYTPSQIKAATPVQASVGTTDASVSHLASEDYPELGTILYDRPDPATIRHTAELGSGGDSGGDGGDGGSSPAPSSAQVASGDADESGVGWDPGEYNNALYHDWRLASHRFIGAKNHEDYHDDTTYLRFGDWPHDERSYNNVTGGKEEGVSVYDLDHHGQPMDPDPHYSRGHEHDEHCEPDCDLDQWNDEYGNDTHEEMNGRVHRAERGRREGYDRDSEVGHLVKGTMVGIGHDGEPLLNNVRRVGDWIDHKHLFFPKTKPHHLARDTDDEDYEPPEEPPKGVPAQQKVHAHLTLGPNPEDRNALKTHLLSHHGYTNDQLSMLDDPGQGDDLIMEHEMEHHDMGSDGISGEFGRGEIEHSKVEHDHKGKGGVANRFPQTTEFNFSGTPQGHYLSSLSSLPGVEASTWIRPHDDDEEDLTDHLVNHHGQDRRFIGDAYGHHDRLHEEADDDDYMGPEPEGEPHEHHDMRDYHPQPWEGKERSGGSSQEEEHRRFLAPGGGHDYKPVPRTIQSLNHLLVTAAMDTEFRFHITAAWRDVQAKAVRIRKAGGVNITHASDGYVIANVQGDHHVYETGLQRVPGRRTAVAVYSCGCRWGAYHWGADDDMSRFAGRMCSHALALQYEAQARGMFGRDVTVDDTKPRWVPSKVVVKYDIDDGRNIQARSSLVVPEQAPLLAVLALADEDDPGLGMVLAAVNDMFGDQTGMTEPLMIDPAGPTVPWNKEENPTSAGTLAGGEPSNWGRINSPTMYPRLGAALTSEAFWQALVPLVKAVAPAVIDHVVNKPRADAGAEATLHDEPEPALPSTDGDGHTASMGDVDLVGGSGIGGSESIGAMGDDELSPENPSMQTMGVQDIVAAFQRSAGAKKLMDGGKPGDTSTSDIAGAAEAYLQKTAASATEFSLAEREALINESPGVQASNTDRLDIAGTHYEELDKHASMEEDDYLWMA